MLRVDRFAARVPLASTNNRYYSIAWLRPSFYLSLYCSQWKRRSRDSLETDKMSGRFWVFVSGRFCDRTEEREKLRTAEDLPPKTEGLAPLQLWPWMKVKAIQTGLYHHTLHGLYHHTKFERKCPVTTWTQAKVHVHVYQQNHTSRVFSLEYWWHKIKWDWCSSNEQASTVYQIPYKLIDKRSKRSNDPYSPLRTSPQSSHFINQGSWT